MCNFRTVTELRLKKHKLRHTDERNYSCNLCGKKFKQPHHVTQHRSAILSFNSSTFTLVPSSPLIVCYRDIVHLGKPSYRERKRIALQQNAAEALGSLNSADFGQTLVNLKPASYLLTLTLVSYSLRSLTRLLMMTVQRLPSLTCTQCRRLSGLTSQRST